MTAVESPARADLDLLLQTLADSGPEPAAEDLLQALEALHRLRDRLADWEPALIEGARRSGVSWGRLAPALGVTSRQAAERRYLRLRPHDDEELTREQRVLAARDQRAGDRAVAAWARAHAAELRQIAGRVSAVRGLSGRARTTTHELVTALTDDDPVMLIAPLARMRVHLTEGHADLAAEVHRVEQRVEALREETQARRGARGRG